MHIPDFAFGFISGVLFAFILTTGVTLRFLMPFIREAQKKTQSRP